MTNRNGNPSRDTNTKRNNKKGGLRSASLNSVLDEFLIKMPKGLSFREDNNGREMLISFVSDL
jgi:hypothetical protein